jgi:hypothetical protein
VRYTHTSSINRKSAEKKNNRKLTESQGKISNFNKNFSKIEINTVLKWGRPISTMFGSSVQYGTASLQKSNKEEVGRLLL